MGLTKNSTDNEKRELGIKVCNCKCKNKVK